MRSISQIYAEAVKVRNNYLQLTELNTKRSKSKMSIMNLLTYVMAVLIYTYETILSAFEVEVAGIINRRVNGTGLWYCEMAKKFQYNPVTQTNDGMKYNDDLLKIEYTKEDDERKIIAKAVYQDLEDERAIFLKVCKDNTNQEEVSNGTAYMPLTETELLAFREYVDEIKFIGAIVYCTSVPADIMAIVSSKEYPIYYDDNYITKEQALSRIKDAIIKFAQDLEYNGYLRYQSVIDVIQSIEHIYDVSYGVKIMVQSYNEMYNTYQSPVAVGNRVRLESGYIKIMDANGKCTINEDNIYLMPKSMMQ